MASGVDVAFERWTVAGHPRRMILIRWGCRDASRAGFGARRHAPQWPSVRRRERRFRVCLGLRFVVLAKRESRRLGWSSKAACCDWCDTARVPPTTQS